jgi:hypothetical protein
MKKQTALEAMKSEKITVTLTLGEIDALVVAAQKEFLSHAVSAEDGELASALGKLDEAVNG